MSLDYTKALKGIREAVDACLINNEGLEAVGFMKEINVILNSVGE